MSPCECDLRDRQWNGYGRCLRCGAPYVVARPPAARAPAPARKRAECGSCHQTGHNRTTCPKSAPSQLPARAATELLRMLIDPRHALTLVLEGKVGEALANATRQINAHRGEGLGHLVKDDILLALAELDLRARSTPPETIQTFRATKENIHAAEIALEAAQRAHTRARVEALVALGYQDHPDVIAILLRLNEIGAAKPAASPPQETP